MTIYETAEENFSSATEWV